MFHFMRVNSINDIAIKVFEHQATRLLDFTVMNKKKQEQPTILFPCQPPKSRYLVKLPHHDPELLSSHNSSPHWPTDQVFPIYFIFVESLCGAR